MTAATEWHDRRPAGWPSQKPVGLITAFLLALLTIPAMLAWQYRKEWTALQRFYLPAYFRSQFFASMSRTGSGSPYLLLDVVDAKGRRMRLRTCRGVGFAIKERQSLRERLFLKYRYGAPMVIMPKREESSHFLIMGDSGTGKSALIRQLLMQIRDNG